MFRIPPFFPSLSVLLCRRLDAVGANTLVFDRRREAFLHREAMWTITDQAKGQNFVAFHFGSQSEGTTTPGLRSDTDMLISINDINIMLHWSDWKRGKFNFLMVKDESTPAQHYLLQRVRSDEPLSETRVVDPYDVIDSQGRVFHSNLNVISSCAEAFGVNHLRRGPSNSDDEDVDYVLAFPCTSLPAEILAWFNATRPGYWPPPEVFRIARQCPCFLVADGYRGSPTEHIEWRVTPNLIERHLMFSLNNVQKKCLIVLKMLKKQELTPHLHEGCKFTTFYCKTALFFTLERTPSDVWREQGLLECIVRCLHTIREFLIQGECPHYIVENVDLFDKKLCRECQVKLEKHIRVMIQDDMHVLFNLQIDDIGERLMQLHPHVERFPDQSASICGKLTFDMSAFYVLKFTTICKHMCDSRYTGFYEGAIDLINELTFRQANGTFSRYESNSAQFLITNLLSSLASVASSYCIQTGQAIPREVWHVYSETLDTDVASSRLKLASMLYCQGDLHRSAFVLNDVQQRLDNSVTYVCPCRKLPNEKPSGDFCEYALRHGNPETLTSKMAFCVRFMREEMYCAPAILWFEMYRSVGDDIGHRRACELVWMDWAEVDALPFMLYLQYLTFGGLRERQRQLQALQGLLNICSNLVTLGKMFHPETVANLLGHCEEMEGHMEVALAIYNASRDLMPRNNAANLHILRLTGLQ